MKYKYNLTNSKPDNDRFICSSLIKNIFNTRWCYTLWWDRTPLQHACTPSKGISIKNQSKSELQTRGRLSVLIFIGSDSSRLYNRCIIYTYTPYSYAHENTQKYLHSSAFHTLYVEAARPKNKTNNRWIKKKKKNKFHERQQNQKTTEAIDRLANTNPDDIHPVTTTA